MRLFVRKSLVLFALSLGTLGQSQAEQNAAIPSLASLYQNYRNVDHPLERDVIGSRTIPYPHDAGDWMHTGDSWVATGKSKPGSTPLAPGPKIDKLRVESFYLDSEIPGIGTNRIYCALARPDTSAPVPVILAFHGSGGHASETFAMALARSFPMTAVITMDYNGQFTPDPSAKIPVTQWVTVSAEMRSDCPGVSSNPRNFPMYHYVCAARTVLDWAQSQSWADKSHAGAVGISYGGWVALALAGVDKRVDAIFNAVSAGGVEGTSSRASRRLRCPPPADPKKWLALAEPLAYAASTRAAVFFALCSNDRFFWPSGAMRNRSAMSAPTAWLLRPNADHYVGASELPAPQGRWMDAVWKRGKPMPSIKWMDERDATKLRWQVSPDAPVTRAWLCWSPGSEIVDSARYWIRFPAKTDKDNLFSAEIPKEWQKYASWFYPLVEFTDGYALSGMLLTRPGLDPRKSPGEWGDQSLWDVTRGAEAWRPRGNDPRSNIEVSEKGGEVLIKPTGKNGEFAMQTNSVGFVSAAGHDTKGLRIVLDGKGQAGKASIRLLQNTRSLDEKTVETVLKYQAGREEYTVSWADFKGLSGEGFHPNSDWWDGLVISGQRKTAEPLGVGIIQWVPSSEAQR